MQFKIQYPKNTQSQFHCFQYPLGPWLLPELLSHMVWAFRGRIQSTSPFPSETLRLLSLEHFPKAQLEKKTHPILQGRSQPCSPILLPQPHLCSASKGKRGKREVFIMESRIRPLAALAQTRIQKATTQLQHKEMGKYHANTCLFLPLCSKGHTVFSLVDCWEVKIVRDREGKIKHDF